MLKQRYNLVGDETTKNLDTQNVSLLLISFFIFIAILFGCIGFGYGLSTFFNLTTEKNDRIAKDMIIMTDIQNLYSVANSSTTNLNITSGIGTSFPNINNDNPSGSINLSNISGVAGNWTNPQLTVNNQGRIAAIVNGNSGGLTTQEEGNPTGTVAGVSTLNFVGDFVTAVGVGSNTTITGSSAGNVHCIMSRDLTAAVAGSIPWNIVISDPLNMYNSSTSQIIVPKNGIYEVSVSLYSTNAASQTFNIYINGIGMLGQVSVLSVDFFNIAMIFPMSAGSTVMISRTSGSNFIGTTNQNLYNFAVVQLA